MIIPHNILTDILFLKIVMDIIVPDNSHRYDHSVYILPDIIIPDKEILPLQIIQTTSQENKSRILSFQIIQSQIR